MSTIYYTATSLDGFLADENDSLDWLLSQDIDDEGPYNIPSFVTSVGAVAMGATTYEWILTHHDTWEYEQPTWVFAHRELPLADGDIRFVSGAVDPVHAAMTTAAAGKDLWIVGGGDLVGQFADAGLLDEVIAAIAPVTLGSGRPLLPRRRNLNLVDVARNRNFVCARWKVGPPLP